MKKNTKLIGGIAIVVALLVAFSYTAKADLSFKQMVALMVAEMAYDGFKAEIDSEVDDELTLLTLGEASGYTNMQHVNFVQGLSIGGRDQLSFNNTGALTTSLKLYSAATGTNNVAGNIYYNSDDKLVKLYDGSQWVNLASSTSATGFFTISGTRLQLTDATVGHMTFGTTTYSAGSLMTLEATSTVSIPLTLRGYTAQASNLFQVHSVDGTELFALDFIGNASTSAITLSGDLWVNGWATTTSDDGNFATKGTLTVAGETNVQGFTQGGGGWASTTASGLVTANGAVVLTEANLLAYSLIEFTFNLASTTVTLPATSTMTTLIANVGDSRTWYFENASSTTYTLLDAIITAGTGIDLVGVTTNDDVINKTERGQLTCIRKTNTDVDCIVSNLLDAD